jgi:hypothetical protein
LIHSSRNPAVAVVARETTGSNYVSNGKLAWAATDAARVRVAYGHLTRDSHHGAITLLDGVDAGGRFVDAVALATTARNSSETAA